VDNVINYVWIIIRYFYLFCLKSSLLNDIRQCCFLHLKLTLKNCVCFFRDKNFMFYAVARSSSSRKKIINGMRKNVLYILLYYFANIYIIILCISNYAILILMLSMYFSLKKCLFFFLFCLRLLRVFLWKNSIIKNQFLLLIITSTSFPYILLCQMIIE
jgi:hypothetical protein